MFLYCILFYRKLVNNHTFFQHPDLIRILRVHENVMAVMMNTLGRRAQAQSDTQAQIQATGQEGEAPPKEKVEILPCTFQFLKETCSFCKPVNELHAYIHIFLDSVLTSVLLTALFKISINNMQ